MSFRFALLALLALLVAGVACGGSGPTSTVNQGGTPPAPPPPPPPAPPAPPNNVVDVTMGEYNFSPSDLTISVGTTVRWTNGGTIAHSTTGDGSAWDSGALVAPGTDQYGYATPGGTYEHTFSTTGTFQYHCTYHTLQNMRGTITVTP